jgi:hypothetical protein
MNLPSFIVEDIRRLLNSIEVYNGEDRAWLCLPKDNETLERMIIDSILERVDEGKRIQASHRNNR